MPRVATVANVLKVEFLWNQDGLPAANVKYVLYSGTPPTAGACAAIANSLGTAFLTANLIALYAETTLFEAVRVTDLNTTDGAVGSHSFAQAGSSPNITLPASASILVNHTIARRYRGGHPRSYYPAPSTQFYLPPNSYNSLVPSYVGAAEAAYALECTEFLDSGCQGVYNVNVSYVTDDADRVAAVVDQITGSVVSGTIRSQRRRLTATSY